MRLSKQEKSFLDYMIEHSNDTPDCWQDVDFIIYNSKAGTSDRPDYHRERSILLHLRDAGCIDTQENNGTTLVRLKYPGYAHKEFRNMELWDQWRERLWGFLSGAALVGLAWFLTELSQHP